MISVRHVSISGPLTGARYVRARTITVEALRLKFSFYDYNRT